MPEGVTAIYGASFAPQLKLVGKLLIMYQQRFGKHLSWRFSTE